MSRQLSRLISFFALLPALLGQTERRLEAKKGRKSDSKVPAWLKSEGQFARSDIAIGLFVQNKLTSTLTLDFISRW